MGQRITILPPGADPIVIELLPYHLRAARLARLRISAVRSSRILRSELLDNGRGPVAPSFSNPRRSK